MNVELVAWINGRTTTFRSVDGCRIWKENTTYFVSRNNETLTVPFNDLVNVYHDHEPAYSISDFLIRDKRQTRRDP